MATHSIILIWEVPWTEEPGVYSPCVHKKLDKTEWLILSHTHTYIHTYTNICIPNFMYTERDTYTWTEKWQGDNQRVKLLNIDINF